MCVCVYVCGRGEGSNCAIFLATTPALLGHAHKINIAKATKKCVHLSSGRTGDVLVNSQELEFK